MASWIVAIALIAGAYLLGKREGLASSITPPTYHQLTFRGGTIRMACFAPDGKNIVYSAAWEGNPTELLVTRPDSPESRPFGLSKAEVLSISLEGEMAVLLNSHNIDPYINAVTKWRSHISTGLLSGAGQTLYRQVDDVETNLVNLLSFPQAAAAA
jgi:hypothetical protein